MPEGPEIRRIADQLEQQILNRVIDRIYISLEKLKVWDPHLIGARVQQINTFGKAIVTQLDNSQNIYRAPLKNS